MSGVHETAYPRFKPNLKDQELEEIYTPSLDDLRFVRERVHSSVDRLSLLVLIKTGQRLGYFFHPSDVPSEIIIYIAKCSQLESVDKNKLRKLEL